MRGSLSSRIGGSLVSGVLLGAGLLCVLPVLIMLAGTAWHDGGLSAVHFRAALSDGARCAALWGNSLAVTLGAVCLALLLGVPLGFLLFRTDLPLRRVLAHGCVLAACVPLYVTATSWMALFGMQFWLYNRAGAAWLHGIAAVPIVVLISGLSFALADADLEDSAALDTGLRGMLRHSSLPMAAWGLGAAAIVVGALTLWDITVTDILMVRTFAEEIFTQFQLSSGPWTATALALPVMLLVFLGGLYVWHVLRVYGQSTPEGIQRLPRRIGLGAGRIPLLSLVLIAVGALVLLPLWSLARAVDGMGNLLTAWRTSGPELVGTLVIAPLSSLVCVLLATVAAWFLVRRGWSRWLVGVGVVLLLSVPAPIVGIGLIKLLNRDGLSGMIYDSPAALGLAYVIRALPFAVLAIVPAMRRIPRELGDVLDLEGASWLQGIRSVVIPMTWPALAAAWLVAFVLSLAEIGASFLVVPPGHTTLTIRFFTLIHYGVYPDAAGVCLLLLLVVGVAALGLSAALHPVIEGWMAGGEARRA